MGVIQGRAHFYDGVPKSGVRKPLTGHKVSPLTVIISHISRLPTVFIIHFGPTNLKVVSVLN